MKLKYLMSLLILMALLTGCSAKSAEQHGSGISVEIEDLQNIKHMTFLKYVDGQEVFSENVVNADESAFKDGEAVWFEVMPAADSTVEVELSYSNQIDGKNPKTTKRIDVSGANEWIDLKLSKDGQLHVIDMK